MEQAHFPSGRWVGFYTYAKDSSRFMMDLVLKFHHGIMVGEGADGIGDFTLSGYYEESSRECGWTKTYAVTAGGHSVIYIGYQEKKGIWGTWSINQTKGGFHIWPIGDHSTTLNSHLESAENVDRATTPPRKKDQLIPVSGQ